MKFNHFGHKDDVSLFWQLVSIGVIVAVGAVFLENIKENHQRELKICMTEGFDIFDSRMTPECRHLIAGEVVDQEERAKQ